MRVRFGQFVLDREARELTRSGQRVALSTKALTLLAALVEGRPRVFSRAELQDLLWPRSAVGYTSLPAVVRELRRILDDRPGAPRFLRTVRGFGYAFCSPAAEAEAAAANASTQGFRLEWGGREVALAMGENLIGRLEACAVRIDAAKISRRHARVTVEGGRAVLEDLGSKNGTFLRGRRLEGQAALTDGDVIAVGDLVLVFRAGFGPGSTVTG